MGNLTVSKACAARRRCASRKNCVQSAHYARNACGGLGGPYERLTSGFRVDDDVPDAHTLFKPFMQLVPLLLRQKNASGRARNLVLSKACYLESFDDASGSK